MARLVVMALGALILTACADSALNQAAPSDTAAPETGVASDDTGLEDTGSGEATWFGIDALITVSDGRIEAATLRHRVYSEEPDDGELCVSERVATEILSVDETPDPVVWHWVEVVTAPDSGDCAASSPVPDRVRLGLGELYPDVAPGVVDAGYAVENMYGAYAALEAPAGDGIEGTTYAYGYAGSVANRAGDEFATTQGPLADGAYIVSAWYLFRL